MNIHLKDVLKIQQWAQNSDLLFWLSRILLRNLCTKDHNFYAHILLDQHKANGINLSSDSSDKIGTSR